MSSPFDLPVKQSGGSAAGSHPLVSLLLSLVCFILCLSGCQRQSATKDAAPGQTPSPGLPASPLASPSVPVAQPPQSKLLPVEFSDVTQASGIRFRHNNGAKGKKYLPETIGSGCAFLDYDSDGWQDILLVNSMDFPQAPGSKRSPMALYHNNQNGTFTDVTRVAGLDRPLYGIGVAVADYDNDGAIDIFITAVGGNRLFRNLGNGRFADVARKLGVANTSSFPTSAVWFDFDKDGKLDLFVASYVDWSVEKEMACGPDGPEKTYCTAKSYNAQASRLYRNLGVIFEDVTEQTRLSATGKSLGIVVVDYDRDGWPDLFVCNDGEPNRLYHNNGRGQFTETAATARISVGADGEPRGARGADAADIDRSGLASFAVAHATDGMLGLFRNEGKIGGLFVDEAPASQVGAATRGSNSFGVFFFDHDLDGWADIFVTNGGLPGGASTERLQLFQNGGKQRFADISRKAGRPFQQPMRARGAAYGDYDNDGDLDIIVLTNGDAAHLLRNDGGNQNRFIRFRAIGTTSNRSGIGTKIAIFQPDGTRLWNYVRSTSGYCSQSELEVTFGLGQVDRIPRAEIEWPSGRVETLTDLAAGQLYTIKEGSGISR